MATHPRLVWPRTDASQFFWPKNLIPMKHDRWYEAVPTDDPRYLIFELRAGQRIADLLRIPPLPDGSSHRLPMPEGYKIFVTHHPPGQGNHKAHAYVYGAPERHGLNLGGRSRSRRFKSTKEWADHVEWLWNTSKPLDLHHIECSCMLSVVSTSIPKKKSPLNTVSHISPPPASPPRFQPRKLSSLSSSRPPQPVFKPSQPAAKALPVPKSLQPPRKLPTATEQKISFPLSEHGQIPPLPEAPDPVPKAASIPKPPPVPGSKLPASNLSASGYPIRPARMNIVDGYPRIWKNAEAGPSRPAKRPRSPSESEPEVPIPVPEIQEDVGITGVAYERALDLQSQRRFRRGELVWLKIQTIVVPGDTPNITHWPVLIADIRFRAHVNEDEVEHTYDYHLRPLGMFSKQDDLIGDVDHLSPWILGEDLLCGQAGWNTIAKEGTRIIKEGVVLDARSKDVPWEARWGAKIKFETMRTWTLAIFRLMVAIKTGSRIAESWHQTDKIEIFAGSMVSDLDRELVDQGRKQFSQGLWLGGERIWMDDIVRLRKTKADIAAEWEGLESGAVLLKIRSIAMERDAGDHAIWRCLVYGDTAELVPAVNAPEPEWTDDGVTAKLVKKYNAPEGYTYRRVNKAGTKARCDISDIAGRFYPDLLDGHIASKSPSRTALALAGRLPGTFASSSPQVWIEDLFAVVESSCREVEKSIRDYYTHELDLERVRAILTRPSPAPRKPDVQPGVLRPIPAQNQCIPVVPIPVSMPAKVASAPRPMMATRWKEPSATANAPVVYELADSSPEP